MKFTPVTVSVNPGLPAMAKLWLSDAIVGVGFGLAVGSGVGLFAGSAA